MLMALVPLAQRMAWLLLIVGCWCSWHESAVLVRPACVLVLRLQGQGTWIGAREPERGRER